MSNNNNQIKDYLKQDNPEYWEGLMLYSQHPDAKKNVIKTCELRSHHPVQQQKLIYELEICIGAERHSGKRAIPSKIAPREAKKLKLNTTIEAPENFEYSVKYEDLPENLQKLAVEKGELYNEMDKLKKEVGTIGTKNDAKSVKFRNEKRLRMEEISARIKKIHGILKSYKNPVLKSLIDDRDLIVVSIGEINSSIEALVAQLGEAKVILINKISDDIAELEKVIMTVKDKEDEDSKKLFDEYMLKLQPFEIELKATIDSLDEKKFNHYESLKAEQSRLIAERDKIQSNIVEHNKAFTLESVQVDVDEDPDEDEELEDKTEWTEEDLQKKFKYQDMSWAERKLLLKQLQSQVPKQLERSKDSKKENTKEENRIKAARGQAMIDILQKFFEENQEDPDKK